MARTPTDIKSLARSHTVAALNTLASIMNQPKAAPAARVSASIALLDRGWGKATLHVESETTVRYVARVPDKATTPEAWQQQHEPQTLQ